MSSAYLRVGGGARGMRSVSSCTVCKMWIGLMPLAHSVSWVVPHTVLSQNTKLAFLLSMRSCSVHTPCVTVIAVINVLLTCARALSLRCCSAFHVPEGDVDQLESAIQHFHDELVHIQEWMNSVPGKQMAKK